MTQYGTLTTLGEFIGKCLPRRPEARDSVAFAHEVIEGLQRLDACQRTNSAVTLSVSKGGGIWVIHNGARLFMIGPGQKALSVITGHPGDWLEDELAAQVEAGTVVVRTGTDRYKSWKVLAGNLGLLWKIIEQLSPLSSDEELPVGSHPRSFPGPARQAALEAFEKSGGYCPGFNRSRHHVSLNAGERIEFDHILPHAKGGPSSDWNIQVLCQECNRFKRARAG